MSVDDWTVTVEVDTTDLRKACKDAISHLCEAKRIIRQIEDWGYKDNLDSWKTLCEVNGIPVLQRNTETGELHAPDDLEGIAAYFESGGTPENLAPECPMCGLEESTTLVYSKRRAEYRILCRECLLLMGVGDRP